MGRKSGRKTKAGKVNGQKLSATSPPVEAISTEAERLRIKTIAKLIRDYPDVIATRLSTMREAKSLFGRLYLLGCLTAEQLETAERLEQIVSRYRRNIGVAGAGAQEYGKVGRSSAEDLSGQSLKRAKKAQDEYDRAMSVLERVGGLTKTALLTGIEKDIIIGGPDVIAAGLDALAQNNL